MMSERLRCTSEMLKRRVSRALVMDRLPDKLVRQSMTEAEALAWSTPYPLLVLPVLMEEKVAGACEWARRQREILERQRELSLAV